MQKGNIVMIRFYDNGMSSLEDVDVVMAAEHITFGKDIWNDGKEYFRQNLQFDPAVMQLLPVENEKHKTICYVYQDREANRELRMLKELGRKLDRNEEILQFRDVFPDIRNVIVCGCNELAYYFVLYLKKQQINVSVLGKYWDLFGYENNRIADFDSKGMMVVYAENVQSSTDSLFKTVIRSASPGFECIDQIYETNVLEGRITDAAGDFVNFLQKIRGRDVVILGIDMAAQDAYDLLYENGIDICCFAVFEPLENGGRKTLLGKKVVRAEDVMRTEGDKVFIDGSGRNSALGAETVDAYDENVYMKVGVADLLDYYGYERNERFFLIRDYTDILCSCLSHVLNRKRVFLIGDKCLCTVLSNYLLEVECGNIDVNYVEISDLSQIDMKETDIMCMGYLWYGTYKGVRENPKSRMMQEVPERKDIFCTEYFSDLEVLVAVDLFMNRNVNKYSLKQFMPKGILLGRIPPGSGNYFFRGLVDGHPDIMKWSYTSLDCNLFLYCIRLAAEKSENILSVFKKLYYEETDAEIRDKVILSKEFEQNLNNLLVLKDRFTSQEVFILLQIAYAETLSGEKIANLHSKIIYWEPHGCPRAKFPFLSKWLDDKQIEGYTLYMHRDNTVLVGSLCKHLKESQEVPPEKLYVIESMSKENHIETDHASYMKWKEFQVRFEDIKLHPKEELMRICDICGIPWSNMMLSTTYGGKPWNYKGVYDFDIKPVFNRYEEYLSEFDHFKIALISSPFQKKYGYSHEDCMKFSRSELQEFFLKEFTFQQKLQFSREKDRKAYFLRSYALLWKQLWIMRRHAVMDDIIPEFGNVQIENKKDEDVKPDRVSMEKEIESLVGFVKNQKRLILYGIGRDCEGLLKRLDETEQPEILFCDKKAKHMELVFHGRKVIAPEELCDTFKDYIILVTSSLYYQVIQCQLEYLGVSSNRIVCNKVQLWGDEE